METSGRSQIRGGAEHQPVARPVGGARKGEWCLEVGVVVWIRGGVWIWAWSVNLHAGVGGALYVVGVDCHFVGVAYREVR